MASVEGFTPDLGVGSFHGFLRCDNDKCLETVSVAGDWRVVENNGDPRLGQYGELFWVRFARPPLRIIDVPASTPESVRRAIARASNLIWVDPSSAANALRVAVEHLLTARGVNKTRLTAKGRRVRLTAHERIELFRAKQSHVADALEAVKWIGNDGSHDGQMTAAEVLVGAEVLELALRSLYDKTDKDLMKKVRKINKSHVRK